MHGTKEKILLTALRLFARDGYEAVSVSDIAGELGITKAALYRHYANKRAILESIVERMERRDAEQARDSGVPEGSRDTMEERYRGTSVEAMTGFGKAMFRYWTQDAFAAPFRRMLTLEQFRDPEMGRLYQQYLGAGPLGYMRDLFDALGLPDAEGEALRFYAPLFLLLSVYDAAEDKTEALALLDGAMERAGEHLTQALRKGEHMDKESICIRRETADDHRAAEELVREAFWNVYRPGCLEHFVLHRLRRDPAFVPELDLVMEKDGRLIGQNMFMRAVIHADDGREIPVLTMGPIGIAPDCKRQGYGKRLLDESLERATALGFGALCFEGNIGFYGKSGFTYASEFGIRYRGLPEGADASFFLCKELIPGYLDGVTGEYGPPEGYFCAEREPEAFEAFDALFPPKEKRVLPGQLF